MTENWGRLTTFNVPQDILIDKTVILLFFVEHTLDKRHVTSYSNTVIKTFADKHTRELFITSKSRRIQSDLLRRAVLKVPPSNRLHALKGDREGQFAISINDQWRICFRFQDGDAYDVEITDYH
jgi:proteic killer suppression protein